MTFLEYVLCIFKHKEDEFTYQTWFPWTRTISKVSNGKKTPSSEFILENDNRGKEKGKGNL